VTKSPIRRSEPLRADKLHRLEVADLGHLGEVRRSIWHSTRWQRDQYPL